ncbi:unnamed protein product [Symbiodinium necroappetens]|uniref:JmjC domain-containing protein n=1 Tax=Symbiodinium necroappetens TaxID=1628268 RepID=A0A812UMF1_9DINO|nr:unnamed protein product [Symbiodinium necroappetens]
MYGHPVRSREDWPVQELRDIETLDEQRPAVLKACTQSPHALCSQSGAAFLLTCLAQRAGEVEVAVEVQERRQQEVGSSFPQISRKKFREFLAELHEASQHRSLWLCDEHLLNGLDVLHGVRQLPLFGAADLLMAAPSLRPQSLAAVWIASAGAYSCWRRDPVCWSTCVFLLLGSATLHLRPSESPPPAALPPGLGGASTAPFSVDADGEYDIQVSAGEVAVVPAGWWYNLRSEAKVFALQLQRLGPASATWALPQLRSFGYSVQFSATSPESLVRSVQETASRQGALSVLRRCCRGLHPVPSEMALPLMKPVSASSPGELLQAMWHLSERYPDFVMSGILLPADAACFTSASLEAFVATAGFWRPPPLRKIAADVCSVDLDQLPLPGHTALQHSPSGCGLPRVIWMFWAQGHEGLGAFRRACINSWMHRNPAWQVLLLSAESCFQYLSETDLPTTWRHIRLDAQADAVRLALLSKYGGVYVDVSVVCNQCLDQWLVPHMEGNVTLAAFVFRQFGRRDRRNHGEYIENWFLACPRNSDLVRNWQAAFLRFWDGRTNAMDHGGLQASTMFKGVDLSCMQESQKNYLTMHCCFKWLIDSNSRARHLWKTRTVLFSADDALGWILELEGIGTDWVKSNVVGRHVSRWLYRDDVAWVSALVRRAPILKFVGLHAQVLDKQPSQHLLRTGSCMRRLLQHALPTHCCTEVVDCHEAVELFKLKFELAE